MLNYADTCTSYRGATDAWGIFWGLWIACGYKAALHNGEGRDSRRAGADLGCAAWTLQRAPRGETGSGARVSPHYRTLRVSFPKRAKVGSAWKELRLQWAVDVPSQGRHMGLSVSELIVFILILGLGCIFYCFCCLSQFFRNAHTHQSFRIKWKTE